MPVSTGGPAERGQLRGPGPAPALPDPLLDQVLVSASQSAQLSHGVGLGVVFIAPYLSGAEREPGDLGQQVGTVREAAQLRPSGSLLPFGQAAPAGMAPGRGGQPGHKQPVTVPSGTILSHPARIEYRGDKCNNAEHLASDTRRFRPVLLRSVAARFLIVTLPASPLRLRRPRLPGMNEPQAEPATHSDPSHRVPDAGQVKLTAAARVVGHRRDARRGAPIAVIARRRANTGAGRARLDRGRCRHPGE